MEEEIVIVVKPKMQKLSGANEAGGAAPGVIAVSFSSREDAIAWLAGEKARAEG